MEQNLQTLAGKHAVVTGGARGIGAAVTRALVASGANVTMLGRSTATSADFAGDPHLHYAQADVCEPQSLGKAFDSARTRFGPIHILVNNAGQGRSAPFLKTDFALWRSMMEVNLDGAFHCIHHVLPAMLSAGWGRIVNIASTAGLAGYSYVTAYCAAKHGVVGLTRSLALEVATKGVTVNAVCPGYTETEMLQRTIDGIVAKTGRTTAEARAELSARNPQKRIVQPEEVANTVTWLCLPGYTETEMLQQTIDGIVAKTGRTPAEARTELSARNPQKRIVQPEEVANTVTWLCLPGSEAITGQSIAVAGGEVM